MKKRIALAGSTRQPLAGAKIVGKPDVNQRIEITIQIRRKPGYDLKKKLTQLASQPLRNRRYLSRAELAAVAGANPADIAKIDAFAHEHHLTVVETSVPRRTIKLSGTIGDMSAAFGVTLRHYKAGAVTYRGRTGAITIPVNLTGIIERVLGLDDRPTVVPHYRVLAPARTRSRRGRRTSASTSYTAPKVAAIYNFPAGLDGSGQTIALIELNDVNRAGAPTGGGYATGDLETYFTGLGIRTPSVTAVGVDGGANIPGTDVGADGEVTLDIEVAGAVAPGAKLAVYFGTNTDDGFIQVLTAAIHDDARRPSIVSISWGGPEEQTTQQLLQGLEQALQDAAALGVTVCAAAGDSGSPDMPKKGWDGKPHADFPASNTYALACGGTTLDSSSDPSAPVETVWNRGAKGGTGGGVSNFFAKPPYQEAVTVPRPATAAGGRGEPDVAGNADPNSGYKIVVGGKPQVFGGTSAVAPLWAGLLARINQRLAQNKGNPVGFVHPLLYASGTESSAFHDITQGNNDIYNALHGEYSAGVGWDPCTGLGTPNGTRLLQTLSGQAQAAKTARRTRTKRAARR